MTQERIFVLIVRARATTHVFCCCYCLIQLCDIWYIVLKLPMSVPLTGGWSHDIAWTTAQHHVISAVSYSGSPTSSHAGVCDLHRHRRCMFHGRCTGPSAITPSSLPRQRFGMRCRRRSRRCSRWGHSSVHWRRNCSADHTATQTIGHSTIDITAVV